jgi:two-component system, OmpR family, heavy metal sensor histidine kinase CusS
LKYPFYSGLSGKIAFIFLAGFIVVILPINLFIYKKIETIITTADNQQLKSEASKIVSQTNLDPVVIPLTTTGYLVHVQIRNGPILESLFSSPAFPTLNDELYFLEIVNFDSLKIVTQRKSLGEVNGELLVSIAHSNRQLNEQLGELRGYLFYLTGGMIIILVMLMFALSEGMLRPLKKIINFAQKINASESMERLPESSAHDETRLLSVTLNNMLTRIEESLNTQSHFFDSATHELRTPLAIMKTQLSLALANTSDASTRSTLQGALEEVERLERTILDFLILSQLKNENFQLRIEECDLAEIVFDKLTEIKRLAEPKSISFQITQTDTHLPVKVDKDKIQTVIFNLLENAANYSSIGSTIKIDLKRVDSYVLFNIENPLDNPIKNIEMLGKKRCTNSNSARGMGLGLWICNQIISMHNGELEIRADNLEFIVTARFKNDIAA